MPELASLQSLRPMVKPRDPLPVKMIAIGDSLTAGMQDANLDQRSQDMAYTRLLANQAGLTYNMPYVGGLGIPPRLFLGQDVDLGRILKDYALIAAAAAPPLVYLSLFGIPPQWMIEPLYSAGEMGQRTAEGKDSPEHPQSNFAVPGFETRHMLDTSTVEDFEQEIRDGATRILTLPIMAPLIHSCLQNGAAAARGSEVDQAVRGQPDLVVLWPGNNDALETVSGGIVDDRRLTPMEDKVWDYWDRNPITGHWSIHHTKKVEPGFASTLTGAGGIIDRLENETDAEIMLFEVPDVTVIPFLRTVGEKVGPLPFRIVLPDNTDVTPAIENWVIPKGVVGDGKGGRKLFPPGSRVGIGKLLKKLTEVFDPQNREQFDIAMKRLDPEAIFTEEDVLDPDELSQISARIDQYNSLMQFEAATHPRVHLVDSHGLLNQLHDTGIVLQGTGDPATVTNTFTGTTDPRGYGGIFSFDGIHPSDVGHAILANRLLDKIQQDLGGQDKFKGFLNVPHVDERAIYAQDPHRTGTFRMILTKANADLISGVHEWEGPSNRGQG